MYCRKAISLALTFALATEVACSPLSASIGQVSPSDNLTSANVTHLDALGVALNLRAVFGANNNALPLVQAAHIIIVTAVDLATGDLTKEMRTQVFFEDEIAPLLRIQVVPESTMMPLKAHHVMWGLGRILIDSFVRPGFTECLERLYLGSEHIGTITIFRSRVGHYDNATIQSTKGLSTVARRSTSDNETALVQDAAEANTINVSAVPDYDGLLVTHAYTSRIDIPPKDLFASSMNAIVGIVEMTPFVASHQIRFRHDAFHTEIVISPPVPPRSSPPFNSRYDCLRTMARTVSWIISQDRYAETRSVVYRDWVPISVTTINRWNPAT